MQRKRWWWWWWWWIPLGLLPGVLYDILLIFLSPFSSYFRRSGEILARAVRLFAEWDRVPRIRWSDVGRVLPLRNGRTNSDVFCSASRSVRSSAKIWQTALRYAAIPLKILIRLWRLQKNNIQARFTGLKTNMLELWPTFLNSRNIIQGGPKPVSFCHVFGKILTYLTPLSLAHSINWSLKIPPHRKHVATLYSETLAYEYL